MSTYVHHQGVHIPGDVHLLKENKNSECVIILIEKNFKFTDKILSYLHYEYRQNDDIINWTPNESLSDTDNTIEIYDETNVAENTFGMSF